MKVELRPCIVKEFEGIDIYGVHYKREKALFHCWCLLRDGTEAGTRGIVEYEDGRVASVLPQNITFCDNKFSEYTFEGAEE